jgi:hypothetical protein
MSEHDTAKERKNRITRRQALKTGAAGAGLLMMPSIVKADSVVSLDVILPYVMVSGKLKDILEKES